MAIFWTHIRVCGLLLLIWPQQNIMAPVLSSPVRRLVKLRQDIRLLWRKAIRIRCWFNLYNLYKKSKQQRRNVSIHRLQSRRFQNFQKILKTSDFGYCSTVSSRPRQTMIPLLLWRTPKKKDRLINTLIAFPVASRLLVRGRLRAAPTPTASQSVRDVKLRRALSVLTVSCCTAIEPVASVPISSTPNRIELLGIIVSVLYQNINANWRWRPTIYFEHTGDTPMKVVINAYLITSFSDHQTFTGIL